MQTNLPHTHVFNGPMSDEDVQNLLSKFGSIHQFAKHDQHTIIFMISSHCSAHLDHAAMKSLVDFIGPQPIAPVLAQILAAIDPKPTPKPEPEVAAANARAAASAPKEEPLWRARVRIKSKSRHIHEEYYEIVELSDLPPVDLLISRSPFYSLEIETIKVKLEPIV